MYDQIIVVNLCVKEWWFAHVQVNEASQPTHYIMAAEFGSPFVLAYVASYMLVTMGCLAIIFAFWGTDVVFVSLCWVHTHIISYYICTYTHAHR